MDLIGFIGCGNMGGALATAVCKAVDPQRVLLSNRTQAKAQALADQLGARVSTNEEIAAQCKFIFLGVKPHLMEGMLAPLAPILAARTDRFVLVSMAAGLRMDQIAAQAGGDYPVIRLAPNTPVSVGKGCTQYCSVGVNEEELAQFLELLSGTGMLDLLDESLMAVAGTLAGCGPAFTYLFLEGLTDGAVACGMPRDKARLYAAQMLAGAAALALESGKHTGQLKDEVCSPGGSTIEGVGLLEQRGLRSAAMDAVRTASAKSAALGQKK